MNRKRSSNCDSAISHNLAKQKSLSIEDAFARAAKIKKLRSETAAISAQPIVIDLDDDESQAIASSSTDDTFVDCFSDSHSVDIASYNELYDGNKFTPYYQNFFKKVVLNVFSDEWYSDILGENDFKLLDTFNSMSDAAQRLYVRLFLRKYQWLPLSKIIYPDIGEGDCMTRILAELARAGFVDAEDKLDNLNLAFQMLSAPSLKEIAKTFKLSYNNVGKIEIRDLLTNHCKKQCTIQGSLETVMLKLAKKQLGKCFRLVSDKRFCFLEYFHLFSLPDMCSSLLIDDPNTNLAQALLFKLLQVERGELRFPAAIQSSKRKIKLFRNREDLTLYAKASCEEANVLANFMKSKHDGIDAIIESSTNSIEIDLHDCLERLPEFLRRFTSAHVHCRILWHCVEALQKLKRYTDAVNLLRRLLSFPDVLCSSYRGRFWERLALNLDSHLKLQEDAFEAVNEGLRDVSVRPQYKLALKERGEKLVQKLCVGRFGKARREIIGDFDKLRENVVIRNELSNRHINGTLLPKQLGDGIKTVFVAELRTDGSPDASFNQLYDKSRQFSVSSVENIALEFYIHSEGYEHGIHDEGAAVRAIFGLLFWDLIFCADESVDDVFLFPNQCEPLDLTSTVFYSSRRIAMDNRFQELKHLTKGEIKDKLQSVWTDRFGLINSIINWDNFDGSHQQLHAIIECIDLPVLMSILHYLSTDYRGRCSGMPDLILWDTRTITKRLLMVEVKGPGDRLSNKQRLWIDFFKSEHVSVEVCYVKGRSSKYLYGCGD